jgi:hypothetical protein
MKALIGSVLVLFAFSVLADIPPEGRDAINAKAQEYGLFSSGPHPETPVPFQTPPPRNHGWYQRWGNNWIYWTLATGAHIARGGIFARWGAEGWEQGPLGFPRDEEANCAGPDARDFVQHFENGAIHWRAATGETAIYMNPTRFGVDGICTANRARFRVTLNGFTCNKRTNDDASQGDGVDDEVYFETRTIEYFADAPLRAHATLRTLVHGDSNNHTERVRSGSAFNLLGGNGGFRDGDAFPAHPWMRTLEPIFDPIEPARTARNPGWLRLPLLAWEGELIQDHNGVLVLATAWESDANLPPSEWHEYVHAQHLEGDMSLLIRGRGDQGRLDAATAHLHDMTRDAIHIPTDQKQGRDRPIGLYKYRGDYRFAPRPLMLTYDIAARIAGQRLPVPNPRDATLMPAGVWWLRYQDTDEDLRGDYILYVQVERLP